jgi:DNA polymerase-3 subunit gamma/tau
MERFVVSARKYRPVTFDTVVGQPHITQTLKNAIRNNHLAQAFLFTGPRGVGKTTTARILAKTINCPDVTKELEACDKCESCTSFNTGHSLNIYELDAASNNSVDGIRALVEQVRYAPQMGRYKVYIIDEVHMLSNSAFNAFLKTLEEPPPYAVFILATTEKHKIIPTILSRCQIFDFNRISVEDIALHLKNIAVKEGVEAEEEALHVIARKADGALRDALSMFDQLVSFCGNRMTYKAAIENLNILDYDYYFRIIDDVISGNTAAVLLAFDEILANGFDAHHFITGLSSHLRDLLVSKDENTLSLLEVSASVRERFRLQSQACTADWLLGLLEQTHGADLNFRSARNQRLHVEYTLLKLCTYGKNTVATTVAPAAPAPVSSPTPSKTTPSQAAATAVPTPAPATTPAPAPKSAAPTAAKPAPPPSPSAAKPVTRRTISIQGPGTPDAEKKNDGVERTVAQDLPRDSYSPVNLQKAWNNFGNSLNEQGRYALATALLKRAPEVKESDRLEFVVDSHAIEKDILEVKADLLAYVRKELNNFHLQLDLLVEVSGKDIQVPYTPTEKFNRLAERNPALNELRKRLDLELEY